MIILRQKLYGNVKNKAVNRAVEISKAKALLESLGYKGSSKNPEDVKNAIRILRIRNRAGQTGAEIVNYRSGITDALVNKSRVEKPNLHQKINRKAITHSKGFERIDQMKEVMKGDRWERLHLGETGPGIPYVR